jgi:cytochrome oxidase Cu insertion factor (SCO1/SenC/PrrC family)
VRRRSFITFCLTLLAVTIIALGYFSWNASIRRDKTELPRYGLAPAFDLKDQNGASLDNERLRGKIWVVNFIDLADSGRSALLASSFAQLDQNFQKAERLTLISIVIPMADQSEPRLTDLSRRYLASSHWHFLSGEPHLIRTFQDRWKLLVSASADGNATSRSFFLVDSEGAVRGIYDGRSPETVQRALEDIGTLLRTGAN